MNDLFRREAVSALAVKLYTAPINLTLLGAQQARDGFERGALPSPVGAKQADDLAIRHVNGHTAKHLDDVAVDDFNVVEFEHGLNQLMRDGSARRERSLLSICREAIRLDAGQAFPPSPG